ncbi:MAG TPA: hypothetical protein VIF62_35610 [Labilithrix sp.]|jgi:hypothetical protein
MDCDAFRASEIDALYGELDEAASAAMEEHAAGCAECAARMQKLRGARSAFAPLVVPSPPGLEAKIMGAVAKAEAAKRAPAQGGAVIRFLARPQLALAAAFVLVAGAALVYGGSRTMDSSRSASVAGNAEPAPAASAAAEKDMAPPPAAMAMATTTAAASGAAAEDPAFVAARSAFENGQTADACPKLAELGKTNDAAALYATRCLARTKGCAAAAPRFDAVAQRNVGNETGARAQLEAARCYRSMGDPRGNSRLVALEDDPWVGDDAKNDLQPPAVAARKATTAPAAAATPASTAGARQGGVARPAPKAAKPADMGF